MPARADRMEVLDSDIGTALFLVSLDAQGGSVKVSWEAGDELEPIASVEDSVQAVERGDRMAESQFRRGKSRAEGRKCCCAMSSRSIGALLNRPVAWVRSSPEASLHAEYVY